MELTKYKNEDDPRFVIQNWMLNKNTIEFLGIWEEIHNPGFNRVQFKTIKNGADTLRYAESWLE